MKLGVSLAYWPWFEVDEQFALARLADELGYHSVWVAEGWGQEATAVLGSLAAITQQIKLGAGIFQIPARQPTTAAVAASTIDRLSNGRMLMGLGLSGPQVSEGWYGVPFTHPLGRTREYIEIVRQVLSGDYVNYRGKHWDVAPHRRRNRSRQAVANHGSPGSAADSHLPRRLRRTHGRTSRRPSRRMVAFSVQPSTCCSVDRTAAPRLGQAQADRDPK